MAKRRDSKVGLGACIATTLWGVRYVFIPTIAACVMSGEVYTMVSTVPAEYVLADAIVCASVAVFVCFFTFLWRYVEHNDADNLDRGLNPMKLKFIGGTALAMIVTGLLAYVASSTLVGYFKVVEPVAVDYCVFGALAALIFGIAFTIIFSEGITAFGKFLEQKVVEAKEVIEGLDIPPEVLKKMLADYAAKEQEPAEPPKEV